MRNMKFRNFRNFVVFFGVLMLTSVAARSQCPDVMPAGTVCISQASANTAAAEHRELIATKDKVVVQEEALKLKEATIEQNKKTAADNEADLLRRLHATEIELATKTGALIKAEQQHNDDQLEKKQLVDKIRKRCAPLAICVN